MHPRGFVRSLNAEAILAQFGGTSSGQCVLTTRRLIIPRDTARRYDDDATVAAIADAPLLFPSSIHDVCRAVDGPQPIARTKLPDRY